MVAKLPSLPLFETNKCKMDKCRAFVHFALVCFNDKERAFQKCEMAHAPFSKLLLLWYSHLWRRWRRFARSNEVILCELLYSIDGLFYRARDDALREIGIGVPVFYFAKAIEYAWFSFFDKICNILLANPSVGKKATEEVCTLTIFRSFKVVGGNSTSER